MIETNPNASAGHASLAERVVDALFTRDRATQSLGMRIVHAGEGACSVEMTVREDMLNGLGTCHGGLLFALADTTFGYACNSANVRAVAASAQIEFLYPAFQGDVLRATAEERSAGKRTGLYDVTVTNAAGKVVALFRGRSYRLEGAVLGDAVESAS